MRDSILLECFVASLAFGPAGGFATIAKGESMKQQAVGIMMGVLVACLASGVAHAHPGRLDEKGCHVKRTSEKLHCHEPWYKARVRRVVDGDTLDLRVFFWIDKQSVNARVRIRGIDAPEPRGKCRKLGKAASAFLRAMIDKKDVYLFNVASGEKFGRPSADIFTSDDKNIATLMLKAGHARPYDGGRRKSWC